MWADNANWAAFLAQLSRWQQVSRQHKALLNRRPKNHPQTHSVLSGLLFRFAKMHSHFSEQPEHLPTPTTSQLFSLQTAALQKPQLFALLLHPWAGRAIAKHFPLPTENRLTLRICRTFLPLKILEAENKAKQLTVFWEAGYLFFLFNNARIRDSSRLYLSETAANKEGLLSKQKKLTGTILLPDYLLKGWQNVHCMTNSLTITWQ